MLITWPQSVIQAAGNLFALIERPLASETCDMRLCVIGCGYVGLVTGTCFAEMGNEVIAVDRDARRIEALKRGDVPIYEPGLSELITRNAAESRLWFTTDTVDGISHSEVIFICVGTPPSPDGSSDLAAVMEVSRDIARMMKEYKLIVVKSTVPVGTCRRIAAEMAALTNHEFDVASNPEFLKEGAAVEDFFRPDRVVVGAESERALRKLQYLYSPFLRTGRPLIAMSTPSSEMTKHVSNAMLASRISFINEVAGLCDVVGADVEEVRRGMAADHRIGPQFLFPGLGFGGSCFPKDLLSLAHVGRQAGRHMHISEAATRVNQEARERFLARIVEHFDGDLSDRTLAFWGLAFKPRTDDVREAPAIWLIDTIAAKWPTAMVRAHDPAAMDRAKEALRARVDYSKTYYDILRAADALVISTEWNEYRTPDFERMKGLMKSPVVFDGRNLYDLGMMKEAGFTYYSVGRPVAKG